MLKALNYALGRYKAAYNRGPEQERLKAVVARLEKVEKENRRLRECEMKRCPFCTEEISADSEVCPLCHSTLTVAKYA